MQEYGGHCEGAGCPAGTAGRGVCSLCQQCWLFSSESGSLEKGIWVFTVFLYMSHALYQRAILSQPLFCFKNRAFLSYISCTKNIYSSIFEMSHLYI